MSSKKLAVIITATVMVGKGADAQSIAPRPDGRPQLLDAELAKYVVDNGAGRFPQGAEPDEAGAADSTGGSGD
jgi:hypothetical protein